MFLGIISGCSDECRTKRPDPAAAQQRSGLQKNRSPIRAVRQHSCFFLQTAERKRILPTLSAVRAFCCADTAPKAETILFHTMPQHLVESPCCSEERQITAVLPYLQRAVFCLSQFAPKILFPSLLWEAQKGNGSWKKNITIRSLRIKPQFRF